MWTFVHGLTFSWTFSGSFHTHPYSGSRICYSGKIFSVEIAKKRNYIHTYLVQRQIAIMFSDGKETTEKRIHSVLVHYTRRLRAPGLKE